MHDELAKVSGAFFSTEAPIAESRRHFDSDASAFDRGVWERFCQELGGGAVMLPDESGAYGVGIVGASRVAEEAGKVLYGGPYLSLWAAGLLLGTTAEEELATALTGRQIVAVSLDPNGIAARAEGERWRLTSKDTAVDFLDDCELLYVTAGTPDGVGVFRLDPRASGVTRERAENLDLTRRTGLLTLNDAVAERLDRGGARAAELAREADDIVSVLRAAENLGSAGRILDDTIEYAKIREQFGRPIGGFQAVKHLLAELYMDYDAATAAVSEAARLLDEEPRSEATREAVLTACLVMGDAFVRISHEAIQIHGGIGFTWEHDAHLYYRRALATVNDGGARGEQLTLLAELVRNPSADQKPAQEDGAPPRSGGDGSDLSAFRARARAWLHTAIDEGDAPETRSGPSSTTHAGLAPAKRYQRKLYEAGFAGMTYPEPYGGAGLPAVYEDLLYEETRASGAGEDKLFRIGVGMIGPVILEMGTQEQKLRLIPPLLRGDEVWCELFSEPGSGSDMANARTLAVEEEDAYVVTGQKVWTSNAHLCDFGLLLARTDSRAPKHRGLTMFIVPMNADGLQVKPLRQITGETDFNEVFLDRVRVPKDNVLGTVNGGWDVARSVLMHERMAMGNSAVRRVSMDDLFELAAGSNAETDPIMYAELAEQVLLEARLRTYFEYISSSEHRRPLASESGSIAKALMTHTMHRAGTLAVRMMGTRARAWSQGSDNGELLRRVLAAEAFSIAGGTDNILRNLIGERVLGLPRD